MITLFIRLASAVLFIMAAAFLPVSNAYAQKKPHSKDSTESIEVHPQDSPESKGFFIESPSKTSRIRILGSIRLFGSNDFFGLSGGTGFSLGEIPVNSEYSGENTFFMTANISRLGLEATQQTGIGELFLRIETDFNKDGDGFRIRHAYGQSEFLIAGQTWTSFSDIETLPNTVDLDGPPTAISKRTVQIKYYNNFGDRWRFRASVEVPSYSVSVPDTISVEPVSQSFPAFAVNLKKDWDILGIKVAGIINPISVRNLDGSRINLLGAGALLSSQINLSRTTEILFQGVYGSGIASFLNLSGGQAYDVNFNANSEDYELARSYGGFIAVSQKLFGNSLDVNVASGLVNFKMQDYYSEDAFERGLYIAVNTFFTFNDNRVGLEYTFGQKRVKSGDKGDASRLAFTFYYDF